MQLEAVHSAKATLHNKGNGAFKQENLAVSTDTAVSSDTTTQSWDRRVSTTHTMYDQLKLKAVEETKIPEEDHLKIGRDGHVFKQGYIYKKRGHNYGMFAKWQKTRFELRAQTITYHADKPYKVTNKN